MRQAAISLNSALCSFQQKLLESWQADNTIVYCNSNKGIGPVGVILDWDHFHGLKHLTNAKEYEVIAEATAIYDVHQLRVSRHKILDILPQKVLIRLYSQVHM